MSDSEDNDAFDYDSDDMPEMHENEAETKTREYYKTADRLGSTHELATKALALSRGDYERAIDALTEFGDLKEYLRHIGFARQRDDVLLEFSIRRRHSDSGQSHLLSRLGADFGWFKQTDIYSSLIDTSQCLCSQETIINAVCGDNPVCYETIMGFEDLGNASYTQRLSRSLLRFMCHKINTDTQSMLDQTSKFLLEGLSRDWTRFHNGQLDRVIFRIVYDAHQGTGTTDQTVTVRSCINAIMEKGATSKTVAYQNCTADVFHTFVMSHIARALLDNRKAVEAAHMHVGERPPPHITFRFAKN